MFCVGTKSGAPATSSEMADDPQPQQRSGSRSDEQRVFVDVGAIFGRAENTVSMRRSIGSYGDMHGLVGTPISRQGYLPDLEPLFRGSRLLRGTGRLLSSRSSPVLGSPAMDGASDSTLPPPLPVVGSNGIGDSLLHGDGAAGAGRGCKCSCSCSATQQGSIWGTVFNMCSATLGAGALSLPYAIQHTGIGLGLLILLATSLATHLSVLLLISAIDATNVRSYEDLTVHLFGRGMGLFVEANIIIFCFGTVVAYTVTVGDILRPVIEMLPLAGWVRACFSSSMSVGQVAAILVFWGCLMLPLSLVDKMSALQCTSLFGVLSLMFLVLSVMAHASWSWAVDDGDENQDVKLWAPSLASFPAMSIIMFAFTCQVNVPSLYEELHHRSPARMRMVSVRAIGVCLLAYACIGIAGYVDFPESRHGNVLQNYDVSANDVASRAMIPSYLAITITVLVAYPVNVFPCRYALDMLLFRRLCHLEKDPSRHKLLRHVGLTLLIAGSGLIIALYVPGINVVFSLMGGTGSAFVCYMLPAAFAWKLDVPEVRGLWGKAACLALFFTGLIIGALSTAVTLMDLLDHTGASGDLCNATAA